MSEELVRAAFETRLTAWAAAQSPPIPLTFENVMFSPPPSRYAECVLIPANTDCETFNGEHRRFTGLYQVKLFMPIGIGPGQASTLAKSLDSAFPMTQPMKQGGLSVFITSPMSKHPPQPHPDRYVVPVSCTYRADQIV